MNETDLRAEIQKLRDEWRKVRADKRARKETILVGGKDIAAVRGDRLFRIFRKDQRRYAKYIRHFEKKLNRKLTWHEKKDR